jgi:hypothetical protein
MKHTVKNFSLSAGLMLSSALLLTGCLTSEPSGQKASAAPGRAADTSPFAINSAHPGILKKGTLYGSPITYEERDGQALFQGDIVLSREQMNAPALAKESGTGRPDAFSRWPKNIVPYAIDPALPQQSKDWIAQDLPEIEEMTNVQFVPRTTELDYVYYQLDPTVCSSPIGRQGLMQPIHLAAVCDAGSIFHETLHALGMWHEQSRNDRDTWITVNFSNINPSIVPISNWDKYSFNIGFDYGPFDYQSIMLYNPYAGAIDPAIPVMSYPDGGTWEPNHTYPSSGDFAAIDAMYPISFTIANKFRDIGIGANGSMWAIGTSLYGTSTTDYKVYRYDLATVTWKNVSGVGGVKIDVDPNGIAWVVQASGKILRWKTGTTWEDVSKTLTKIKDVGIGANGKVWVTSAMKMDANLKDYTVWNWTGTGWAQKSGGRGLRLSVDEKGNPWTVGANGEIRRWSGSAWVGMYFPYGAGGKDIGIAGDGTVYIIGGELTGTNYGLYQKSGAANDHAPGHDVFFNVNTIGGTNVDAAGKAQAWVIKSDKTVSQVWQF